jgi:hypothetical protein
MDEADGAAAADLLASGSVDIKYAAAPGRLADDLDENVKALLDDAANEVSDYNRILDATAIAAAMNSVVDASGTIPEPDIIPGLTTATRKEAQDMSARFFAEEQLAFETSTRAKNGWIWMMELPDPGPQYVAELLDTDGSISDILNEEFASLEEFEDAIDAHVRDTTEASAGTGDVFA